MTTKFVDSDSFASLYFQKISKKNNRLFLQSFKRICFFYAFVKSAFYLFFFAEILALLWCFIFSVSSSLFAIILGVLFLSIFSYLVLLFYLQTKKPLQLEMIKERFFISCRKDIALPQGVAETHLLIAQAALQLVSSLHDIEYGFYSISPKIKWLQFLSEKISFFFHYEDVFSMKELFLKGAIEEHISQIHLTPTDLEIHASLANVYVRLSRLYIDDRQMRRVGFLKERQIILDKKFHHALQCAIEELTILKDYAPKDPWVHSQLAQSFHMMKMPKEEAKEYEILLQLSPHDHEICYRLGKLYFELGENAKGLQIYEELKKMSHKKADDLIVFYGRSRVFQ